MKTFDTKIYRTKNANYRIYLFVYLFDSSPVGVAGRDAGNLRRGTAEEVDECQWQSDRLEHDHHQRHLPAADLEQVDDYTAKQDSQAYKMEKRTG